MCRACRFEFGGSSSGSCGSGWHRCAVEGLKPIALVVRAFLLLLLLLLLLLSLARQDGLSGRSHECIHLLVNIL